MVTATFIFHVLSLENTHDNIGHRANWAYAVNYCTSLNTTLSNAVGNSSSDVWSRYFRYKKFSPDTDKKRRKCVAVFINTNKRSNRDYITWSHYQHRNCSELLPFICVEDIDMYTNVASVTSVLLNSNVTDSSTLQNPSKKRENTENDVIVKVNIVLLMLSIVMIVLLSVRVCCKKTTDPK